MNKLFRVGLFGVLSCILGAFAGAIVWLVLKVMSLGIDLLWIWLPEMMNCSGSLVYPLIVCAAGGVIIGLWQKKYGLLPEDLEQVMARVKNEGSYPYNNLHIIAVSALLPLIFGGALGPEAGLTGLIVGLSYFVGDRLKYKGEEVAALMESGIAATLGVVFNAPLFGIIGNLEPDNKKEKYGKKLASKKTRIFLYIMGVIGGMLAVMGLGRLLGSSGGLPRFEADHGMSIEQWKWFIPIVLVGVICGLLYLIFGKLTKKMGEALLENRITSCVIVGVIVAVFGYFLPLTMFSGEHEMGDLMVQWQVYPVAILIMTGLGKLLMVNICINFGWRGGNIFPIIFAGVAIGYGMAGILGIDGSFTVAVMVAALYTYIMRKPFTVVAVLLLCFPIAYIVPVTLSALAASKIPVPKALIK
ncbi:MAG: chloride channel protein [Clostridiales bacterium]|nr:chloride channel protein [Clostridiales bacterium]